jgi:tetratricopeptide (TPR) repeat protein
VSAILPWYPKYNYKSCRTNLTQVDTPTCDSVTQPTSSREQKMNLLKSKWYFAAALLVSFVVEAKDESLRLDLPIGSRAVLRLANVKSVGVEQDIVEAKAIGDDQFEITALRTGKTEMQFFQTTGERVAYVVEVRDMGLAKKTAQTQAGEDIKKSPSSRDELFKKAEMLKKEDKIQEAVSVYETVLQANPKDAEAHMRIGSLYAKMSIAKNDGELVAKAKNHYKQFLELAPKDHPKYKSVEDILRSGK